MSIVQMDPIAAELERQREEEEREHQLVVLKEKYSHEEKLAAIKAKAALIYKTRQRVAIAAIKMPVVLVLAPFIAVLVLCKREVPRELKDFINL